MRAGGRMVVSCCHGGQVRWCLVECWLSPFRLPLRSRVRNRDGAPAGQSGRSVTCNRRRASRTSGVEKRYPRADATQHQYRCNRDTSHMLNSRRQQTRIKFWREIDLASRRQLIGGGLDMKASSSDRDQQH
jgi:hypothetical protein